MSRRIGRSAQARHRFSDPDIRGRGVLPGRPPCPGLEGTEASQRLLPVSCVGYLVQRPSSHILHQHPPADWVDREQADHRGCVGDCQKLEQRDSCPNTAGRALKYTSAFPVGTRRTQPRSQVRSCSTGPARWRRSARNWASIHATASANQPRRAQARRYAGTPVSASANQAVERLLP